ncbi:GNAT family N-acetyltransferase [Candidatus Laterigemmans baculatus]|uniref:N-acetyltransferase n=1 Tax=Candidatus Laterigemmans baculatus TaxID=2770505 RepID=UPI0013DC8446|nr:N-acetyltransferase [Candidatus Laterigemmans baculatus]
MADALRVWEVHTRADQKAFNQIQKDIYVDDPNWIPPLWRNQEELVGFRRHPFYDDAESAAFLVAREGEVVGRVVAIVNHAHNRRYNEKRGFFGFFECRDDPEAAAALMGEAARWLVSRGMTALRGPTNPSMNYECGLLVDGFDSPPAFMITHNRPYYEKLLTGFGLEKTQDLFCYHCDVSYLETMDPKVQRIMQQAKERFRVDTRPLNKKRFREDVKLFLDIYNRSLEGTWGCVPLSPREIDHQSLALRFLLVPALTSIASIDGKPIGAGFGLLDYNPLIRKINGKLFPFGWLTLLRGRRHLKRLRLISANVLPEYQKWGLGLVTLERIMNEALAFGITQGELSWVLESNLLSRGTIERGGATRSKTHRIYDRSLADIR